MSVRTYYSGDSEVKVHVFQNQEDDKWPYRAEIYYCSRGGKYEQVREEFWTDADLTHWIDDHDGVEETEQNRKPQAEPGMPPYKQVDLDDGRGVRWLKTKWDVCPRCQGRGEVGNPSFDGLSPHELTRDDPDFFEDYLSGVHNISCPRCKGKRVVGVVDRNAADPTLLAAYDRLVEEQLDWKREQYNETRRELWAAGDRDPFLFYADDYEV